MYFQQGIDIVDVRRIKSIINKYNLKFLKKILSDDEIKLFSKNKLDSEKVILKIAGMFAAKEAASKALGTGLRNGIKFSDFEIFNDEQGRPFINFCGKAKETLSKNSNVKPFVSISNERIYVVALVSIISF